jgi:hypothetical protein
MSLLIFRQNPLIPVVLFCITHVLAIGGTNNNFENKFYLGLKGGINLSHVKVLDQYQIFSNIGDEEPGEKEYNSIWKNLGYQYGFIGLYHLSEKINLIFEPTFTNYIFGYSSSNTWQDNENFSQTSSQNHKHNLRYFELPVLLQFYHDLTPLKPYFLVGGYYGYLLGAEKIIDIEEYTTIDGQNFNTSSEYQHVFFNEQYIKSRLAAIIGIGAIYDLTALQLMFEFSYHYSFNNITRENARFSNQLVTGSAYDINDNINLNAIEFNIRLLFPINKPSNLLKSLKCK